MREVNGVGRGPFGFAQGRLFDSATASLSEAVAPLRMTSLSGFAVVTLSQRQSTSHSDPPAKRSAFCSRFSAATACNTGVGEGQVVCSLPTGCRAGRVLSLAADPLAFPLADPRPDLGRISCPDPLSISGPIHDRECGDSGL